MRKGGVSPFALSLPVATRRGARRAFSLTELLVASAIALVVIASVASLFSIFSRALSQTQAAIELTAKMRSAAWQLRQDLAGVTVRMRPPVDPEANSGYFELIEGPQRDTNAAANSTNLSADTDDILLFTTKSAAGPFVGRYGVSDLIESDTAEVAWFCRRSAVQPDGLGGTTVFTLYRRQRLVVGYVGKTPFLENGNQPPRSSPGVDWNLVDISMRMEEVVRPGAAQPQQFMVPNTLADLTDRKNRFGHDPARFPFPVPLADDRMQMSMTFDGTNRVWEDVVLTNVIAFDVRVFEPGARAQPGGPVTLLPGDLGYSAGVGAYGAYVDLGQTSSSSASSPPAPVLVQAFPPPGLAPFQSGGVFVTIRNPQRIQSASPNHRVYDTWNLGYEFNGIDEDGDDVLDSGFNGRDDNNNGIVDEAAEFETSAPYPVPLRGIEVRIRCYEPVGKQVRQITIRQAFKH